jgi:Fic family protein
MTDDALAQAAAATEPTVAPYIAFPSFADWEGVAFGRDALDRFVKQLDELRRETDAAALQDAVSIATRWAAVNTGAIEGLFQVDRGFTYSVAVSAAAWDNIHALKGQFAASSIEDAVRAYDFVLDAATGNHPITEVWVRELHEIVSASQEKYTVITAVGSQEQDLPKGEYKSYPNNPLNFDSNTVHSYAPPIDTPSEMARLIAEMRSDSFLRAHPVMQAAYAHYAFVCIHPFADGNGRVARALAATFLYRGIGVPLVIFADQKADYLNALESADAGVPTPFVRFVSERVIDTISMVKEQVLTAAEPDTDDQLSDLQPLLLGLGGLTHDQIDAITIRVGEAFGAALQKQVTERPLREPMSARTEQAGGVRVGPRPPDYRMVPNNYSGFALRVRSAAPASGEAIRGYAALTRLPNSSEPDFAVVRTDGTVVLTADLRDVHPTISQAFVFRAEAAALRELRQLTAEVSVVAEQSLRAAGYLS